MKLLRWTLAGASFYVVYKYAIGKKAKGEQVFTSPEDADTSADAVDAAASEKKPASSKRKKPD